MRKRGYSNRTRFNEQQEEKIIPPTFKKERGTWPDRVSVWAAAEVDNSLEICQNLDKMSIYEDLTTTELRRPETGYEAEVVPTSARNHV